MDNQPEALRWADVLVRDVGSQLVNRKQAAAELRRLHAVVTECDQANHALHIREMDALQRVSDLTAINAKLLEALEYSVDNPEFRSDEFDRIARAAIAAATDETSR